MATSPSESHSFMLRGSGVFTFPCLKPTRRVRTGRGRTGGGKESTSSNSIQSLNSKIFAKKLKCISSAMLHRYQRIIHGKLTKVYKSPCLWYHSAVFFIPDSKSTAGTKPSSFFAL